MGKGRKPATVHELKRRGETRPSRLREDAPKGSATAPEEPVDLSQSEAMDFREIVSRLDEIGSASSTDVGVISLAARRMTEIRKLTIEIEEKGFTYETFGESGRMIKANPAVRMRSDAMRHLHSLEATMGLTPTDRRKLGGQKPQDEENEFASLRRA